MRNAHCRTTLLFAFAIAVCIAVSAAAQLEPSLFSIGEQLSGFNEASVEGIGMGSVTVALDSADPINPAQNAELEGWWTQVRGGWINTSVGTGLDSYMLKVAGPIGSKRHPAGLAFHYQKLESNHLGVNIPMPPPNPSLAFDLNEYDWGVSYGRKVGRNLSAGLTIAGDVDVEMSLLSVPGAMRLGRLDSGPKSGISGARVGALYTPSDDWRLGLLFSVGGSDVDVTTYMPEPVTESYEFDTWSLRVGWQYLIDPKTRLAMDVEHGHISGYGPSQDDTMWFAGIEHKVCSDFAVRMGTSDGPFSVGAGYSRGGWSIDYAYVNDRYRSGLGPLYGGNAANCLAVHKLF